MARKLRLDVDVDGAPKAKADLAGVARGIDDVGDEAAQAERQLARLSREITETQLKAKALALSFNDVGDSKLFADVAEQERSLTRLRRLQKALNPPGGGGGILGPGGGGAIAGQLRLPGLDLLTALGPKGLAGIGAVAAPLATSIGGLAAAMGLLTAGLSTVGGGVALSASSNERVQGAFSGLGKDTLARLQADASSFADPLVKAAEIFGDAFARQEPRIKSMLESASKLVEPLARGISGFVEELLPGFEHAVQASESLIGSFSSDFLPTVGAGISELFESVSQSGPGAAVAMNDLGDGIRLVLETSGDAIQVLSALNSAFHELDTLGGALPSQLERSAAMIEFLSGGALLLADAIGGTDSKLVHATGSTAGYTAANIAANAAAQRTIGLLREMSTAFDETFNNAISLTQAHINHQSAIDDLSASIKENGRSFDISSGKGRANSEALLSVLRAAEALRLKEIEAGTGIGVANRAFQSQVEAIGGVLRAAGLGKAQIDALLASWIAAARAPNIVKTLTINMSASNLTRAMLSGRNPLSNGPAIKTFAEGGLVGGQPGAPQLAVVHGGEYVLPRNQTGRANTGGASPVYNITVHAGLGTNGHDVGRQIVAELKSYEMANGTGWRASTG